MSNILTQRRFWVILSGILLGLGLFIADILYQMDVAGSMLYVVVILLSLWLSSKKSTYIAGFIVSFFILIGFLLPLPVVYEHDSIINRVIALTGTWIAVFFIASFKNSLSQLQDQEQSYRALFDAATEGFLVSDTSGNILQTNPKAREIFGYKAGELEGKSIETLVPPQSREQHKNYRQQYYRELTPRPMGAGRDLYGVRKDGTEIPVEISLNYFTFKGRTCIITFIIDITERKKSEERVRFQANILENVRDCIIVTDLNGKITYWNQGAENIFQYTEEETTGNTPAFLYPEHSEKDINQNLEAVLKEKDITGEWKGRKKDGSIIWLNVSTTLLKDQEGNPTGFISISQDITNRKAIEKSLEEEKNFISAILQTTNALILVLDPNGNIVRFNPTCEAISGKSSEEVTGKSLWNAIAMPEEDDTKTKEVFRELLETGASTVENFWLDKNGNKRLISWSNTALPDEQGNISYIIATGIDITERKRMENNQINAMLEGQEKERQRIATDLHDNLGQILSVINLNMNVLENEITGLPQEKQKWFHDTKSQIEQAIQEVRNISRNLSAGSLENTRLNKALELLCERINKSNQLKVHFFANELEKELYRSIKFGIYRIAQELLNNVLKHSNATEANVQLIQHPDTLVLMVEDNGKGFSEPTEKIREKGFGFQSITGRVNSLQGKINIDSYKGKGTSITVEVPLTNQIAG